MVSHELRTPVTVVTGYARLLLSEKVGPLNDEQRGFVDSDWRISDRGRRARYYSLTHSGRKALGEETASWRSYVDAVEGVLAAEPVEEGGT